MSQVKDLYIFRHGQTEWNQIRRFQGHSDIPLNETGRSQAESLKGLFDGVELDIILSSDLSRAVDTAEIALSHKSLEILKSPQLRETHLGETEGMHDEDIIKTYGDDAWRAWLSHEEAHMDFSWPGGETKRESLNRAKTYIEDFSQSSEHHRIAVATHGGVLKRLIALSLEDGQEAPVRVENCSLYHLQLTGATWTYVKRIT